MELDRLPVLRSCGLSVCGKFRRFLAAVSVASLALASGEASAVPSFARQTGMQCTGCHTIFPDLNGFGRQFKLRGYTLGSANTDAKFPRNLPVSAVLQVSRTATANQNGVGPQDLPRDREGVIQAAGVYYAGRITERTGALAQYNYDGIERKWAVEMVDVRFADSVAVGNGREVVWGLTLNNSPTLTDLWNSTPAWSFPHVNAVGVMPVASPLLDMGLMSQVGGVTAYGMFDNLVFAEAGIYRSARKGILRPLGWGVDKTSVVDGNAPYWRLALQRDFGAHSAAAGLLGLNAKVLIDPNVPGTSADRFRDVGFDAQYQYVSAPHEFSSHLLFLRERQWLGASFAQGMASNERSVLTKKSLDLHYLYNRTIGGTVQFFSIRGDADPMRYGMGPVMGSASGSPDTSGWVAEVDYLPAQNVKLAIRRTVYRKFNGASVDYDGSGRNASDNNNWYVLAWFMF